MSNVAKLKKKAAEFEAKKQFDKALGVYLQILNSASPGDEELEVALFNRVGDLMLRQGNTAEAVTYYEKAVDLYAEGGFFNNAIALCNKILRQSPGRSVVYYKLGKISAKKGFRSDAKQNFLEYADRMQQAGQIDEAFRALKEFADLVPDQEDVRLMLAEQLSKKDRKPEALEQLQILHAKYEHEGRTGEARAALDRMRTLDPAIQPKTAAAPRAEKPSDLVFLDVSWEGSIRSGTPGARPAVPPVAAPAPAPVPPPVAAAPPPDVTRPTLDSIDSIDALDALDTSELDDDVNGIALDDIRLDETDADDALDEPPVHVVAGLSTGAGADDAAAAALDSLPLLGLEATSFEVADLEPPMSGSAFGALPLDAPTHDGPDEPAHDLVLHGDLPAIGGDLDFIVAPDDSLAAERFDGGAFGASSAAMSTSPLDLDLPFVEDDDDDDDDADSSRELTFLDTTSNELTFLDLSDRAGPGAIDDASDDAIDDASDDASRAADEPHDVEPSELALAAELDAPLVDPVAQEDDSSFAALELVAHVDSAEASVPETTDRLIAPDAPAGSFIMQDASDSFGSFTYGAEDGRALVLDDGAGSTLERFDAAPLDDGDGERFDAASLATPTRPVHAHSQAIAALRSRVEGSPDDSALRRRLAELLLDAGDRDEGVAELERAMAGYERAGDIDQARSVVDDIIRLQPNSVAHHQKRVEFAFRSNDRARLGDAYLELADALFRSGQGDKARAVYDRVLELAPDNQRARAALNIVATPPSTRPALPDETATVAVPPFVAGGRGAGSTSSSPAAPEAPPAALLAAPTKPTDPALAAAAARPLTPMPAPAATPAPVAARPAFPTSPAPAAPTAPRAPAPRPGDDGDFVNLGDWLSEDSTPKSTRMVTDAKEPVEGEEFDFAEMLAKFKQGVAENVDEDDHESHYDLGVAFKEMGLVEEAISEFQKALRSTSRRTRTYEALGQCFLEQSQFAVASTVLKRALAEPGIGDEQLVGVLYLLGYASEALGRKPDAIDFYERVFAVDIRFRDVTDRLNALQQTGAR